MLYSQHCPWLVHLADKLLDNDPVTAQLLAPGGNPFAISQSDNGINGLEGNRKSGDKSGDKSGKAVLRFVRAELYEVSFSTAQSISIHLHLWLIRSQCTFICSTNTPV